MNIARWSLALLVACAVLSVANVLPAAAPGDDKAPVKIEALFVPAAGKFPARLILTADIEKKWHVYSVTQGKGGPYPTKIKLDDSAAYKLAGDFTAIPKADAHKEAIFDNLLVETHEGKVTWWVQVEVSAGFDATKTPISGKLTYQACNDENCLPPTPVKVTAKAIDAAAAEKLLTEPKK
jgi:suppressor for copper-sensitivity B